MSRSCSIRYDHRSFLKYRWRGYRSNDTGTADRHLLRLRLSLLLSLLLSLFRIKGFDLGEEPWFDVLELISSLHDVSRSYLRMGCEALICVHADFDGQGTTELPTDTKEEHWTSDWIGHELLYLL